MLKIDGLFLYDPINRNPVAKLATITIAYDILRLLPHSTHDPGLFIKPAELKNAMVKAGLLPGAITGLGPRGLNRRFDITFEPLLGAISLTIVLSIGVARKPILAV